MDVESGIAVDRDRSTTVGVLRVLRRERVFEAVFGCPDDVI
jgi:hypothetical protein